MINNIFQNNIIIEYYHLLYPHNPQYPLNLHLLNNHIQNELPEIIEVGQEEENDDENIEEE